MRKNLARKVLPPLAACGPMNNKILLITVCVLFVGSYFAGQWLQSTGSESKPADFAMQYENCSPVLHDCEAHIQGHRLVIKFLQEPSALTPFTVRLRTEGFHPSSINVEFTMQGMDMGFNRYRLQPVTDGVWETRVTLPVCSLGRNDWSSRLEIDYQDKTWFADFDFEQSGN